MSARTACKECPFRAGSAVCYDSDSMDALDDGNEPSCHMVVGVDSIFFSEPLTDKQRCHGHALWLDGIAGYQEPSGAVNFTPTTPDTP